MKLSRLGALTVVVSMVGCGDAASKADDGTLLSPYLAIADALAHDGVEPVAELAPQVAKLASASAGEPGADALGSSAATLAGQDLETARTTFKTMSAGMIEYLRAHPDQQAGLTLVHCPMAFSGKGGVWVQREGKVMNPYEGSRMLHCGEKLGWSAELPQT
ncbi:MAG: hypothetical protein AB1Z98_23255 [Nannocystaceae bacterium]